MIIDARQVSGSLATPSGRSHLYPQRCIKQAASFRSSGVRGSLRRRLCISAAAEKSFYQILDVDRSCDLRTLKKAYKKKALKLHPDVNKEENAKDLFMECKTAYQTLSDPEQRRKYDRALDGSTGGIDWGSFGDAFKGAGSSSTQSRKKPRQEEEFYGFDAFFKDFGSGVSQGVQDLGNGVSQGFAQLQTLFRDLDKDFQERRGKETGQPRSLWQEVYDLGEEFVEYLEQEIAAVDGKGKKGRSEAAKAARGAEAEAQSTADAQRVSAEEEARKAKESAEVAKRKSEEEIEDMLAELKQNLKSGL